MWGFAVFSQRGVVTRNLFSLTRLLQMPCIL